MSKDISKIIELTRMGKLPLPVKIILNAIQETPANLNILFNLAIECAENSKFDQAIQILSELAANLSNEPEIFFSLAFIHSQKNEPHKAMAFYEKTLKINPVHQAALINIGATLNELKRYPEAIEFLDKATKVNAMVGEAWSNKASALSELGKLEDAISHFDRAIDLKPNYVDAYLNRGNTLVKLGKLDKAHESYDAALKLSPNDAEVHWNKSTTFLLGGDLQKGWGGYEWRWRRKKGRRPERVLNKPLWLGQESLKNKTILLYSEQGFGDTIQFCRYVKLVANLGAKVILQVQPELVSLLKNLEGVYQILAQNEPLPDFDFQCPLLSLPLAFNTSLETIPVPPCNLYRNPKKRKIFEDTLKKDASLNIGIAWSGSTAHQNDKYRSLSLSQILPFLPEQHSYTCLQKEVRNADLDILKNNPQIRVFGDELLDFSDTAALCEVMDLVISVDTSVAHLASTLGRPTWILLPQTPDWRWLLGRDDTPWYPSMKLFRQHAVNDWGEVLGRVENDLSKLQCPN